MIDLDIGTGVVEGQAVHSALTATPRSPALTRFLEGADQVVAREVTRIRQENISLIVADVSLSSRRDRPSSACCVSRHR